MGRCSYIFSVLAIYCLNFGVGLGCNIDGVSNNILDISIKDIDRGEIFRAATTGITDISSIVDNVGLSKTYYNFALEGSDLVITTTEDFKNYEEIETESANGFTAIFACPTATLSVTILISITDTNNNDPAFLPSSEITYTVTPPLPPNYFITGCTGFQVRDIDLTTKGIDFEIEPNDFIEVAYDKKTTDKIFQGTLRTKSFIRSLPEPLILWIKATDIDETGDPRRTTTGTLRLEADGQLVFPDEPVFSRTFYTATYSDGAVQLQDTVTLSQGYDDDVRFSIAGEYSEYFSLKEEGNSVTVEAKELPSAITILGQILLELKAERNLTSGASATLVLIFPEEPALEFAEKSYQGQIIDNSLTLPALLLSQGFESGYNISIENDHAEYFTPTKNNNQITITMSPLSEDIIAENSFLTLRVVASNEASTAVTVVLLEIIKDDTETPVFASQIYEGSYDTINGLSVPTIELSQGYDSSVQFYKSGEYESLFTMTPSGNSIVLALTSALPEDILTQQHLLLTIGASKPRTVGAHTTVSITLPRARALSFEEAGYRGSLEGDVLTLPAIRLTTGFADDVKFTLNGDYASSFTIENDENVVSVILSTPIAENVIQNNNFLALTLEAKGVNTLTAVASIVVDVIKDDAQTPVFAKHVYYGTSLDTNGITLEDISLVQGYDDTVTFSLSGDDAQYFNLTESENKVRLELISNIPEDVVFEKKVLIFNILAAKPRTVGANAALSMSFPSELTDATVMKFSKNAYVGTYENNLISLEKAVLQDGFAENTTFDLSGEYASNFDLSVTGNSVALNVKVPLPADLAQSLVVLELTAARVGAVAATASLVIDIVVEGASLPVFDKAYYEGSYNEAEFLFEDSVYLIQGFDDTVTFNLEGDLSEWFSLSSEGSKVTISLKGPIPEEILQNNSQLLFVVVANKPGTDGGRAVISVSLTKECSGGVLRFARSHYVGRIESGSAQIEDFTLLGGWQDGLAVSVSGEYGEYFNVDQSDEKITLSLKGDLPTEAFSEYFIILEIQVSRPGYGSGFTTAILEITKDSTETPIFEYNYYTGSYSKDKQLVFEPTVQLIQGFDDTVEFALEDNADASWFVLEGAGNSWTLALKNDSIEVSGRSNLVFSILAAKPGAPPASSAVVITLTDVSSAPLRFTQQSYSGSLQSSELTLEAIKIEEGYTESLRFSLSGEYSEYFEVANNNNEITVQFKTGVTSEVLQDTNIIIMTIRAESDTDVAYATIVIEIRKDTNNVTALVFQEAYYSGSYSEIAGLSFDQQIRLIDEFDDAVLFALEGEQKQWFEIQINKDYVTLTLKETLPTEVLTNYRHLLLSIVATKENHLQGKAAVIISLDDDLTSPTVLRFEQNYYEGKFSSDNVILDSIKLSLGYSDDLKYTYKISGDLKEYFKVTTEGSVSKLELDKQIPEENLDTFIILELEVSAAQSISAYTTIILKTDVEEENLTLLVFEKSYYVGSYTVADKLNFENIVTLAQGYNENVVFSLEEGYEKWFLLQSEGNTVTITLVNEIPSEILLNNRNLIFTISASLAGVQTASTSIIISLEDDIPLNALVFEKGYYTATYTDQQPLQFESVIKLSEGYDETVSFSLEGDLARYFTVDNTGAVVTLSGSIPDDAIPDQSFIVLELVATSKNAISASATIIITLATETSVVTPVFTESYYAAKFSPAGGLKFETEISLRQGYDETVTFALSEEGSRWFLIRESGNSVTIIPTADFLATELSEDILSFSVIANKPGTKSAEAGVIVLLQYDTTSNDVSFEKALYTGVISGGTVQHEDIVVTGFEGTIVEVLGEYGALFEARISAGTVTVQATDVSGLPTGTGHVTLELQAGEARTVLVLVIETDIPGDVYFEKSVYTGTFKDGTVEHEAMKVSGYDGTVINISGAYSELFTAQATSGVVVVRAGSSTLPAGVALVTLTLQADTAAAVLVLTVQSESTPTEVFFSKTLYTGSYKDGVVAHEDILVTGYNGNTIKVIGELSSMFSAAASAGAVEVQATGSSTLPSGTSHVVLELEADSARAVLILEVIETEAVPPAVSFSSESYEIRADVSQTGLVGRVQATADNNERVTYAVVTDNEYLQARVSVSADGELQLFAPVNSGVYSFSVSATTVTSQVTATAPVRLTVEAVTVCDDDLVVPPLIVLERDEEEPHADLVIIDGAEFQGCRYTLTNRWPLNQSWLYVDDRGLHARAIDREDESIAFMALSQVQVELVLYCDNDTNQSSRSKRSLNRVDWLGPYDYGNNKWTLTESIGFNSRRSFVNLIVNDINDNDPIFVEKANEPIAVGYPVPDLLDVILPRALTQLTATDADIGENAALLYWSPSEQLAVAPGSGLVHVNRRALPDGITLAVHATDRNGQGNTGTIQLVVRLLTEDHIAVVTVRDSFLEDEESILKELNDALGYEVKVLNAVVISDEYEVEGDASKNVRSRAEVAPGTSLQLYLYGLEQRQPVEVERLTSDISSNFIASVVVDSVSLRDYLESREICSVVSGRDIGLLAATIVLSILLIILIASIALWFFLKWRKNKNYDNFSDENSLPSRDDGDDVPKIETRPRIDIEELKRSERRLQERLEAPISTTVSETSKKNPLDTKIDVPLPEVNVPIVIQSIDKLKRADDDDEDEFGEINDKGRRKSMVTFNENVEKIIHVEDIDSPEYENARL
ncbi:uncharacterized protein LOC105384182 isoform X3 [Plutella xylostella]|uniref:uncharacterized protein LOC105384182 isoform X3 n=1 Tax=Plutella xylostella TaxID=51655 RepID=UPI002032A211|nr:uncharacterized protein LOC105384182 isoform X3 [Plutella xylostella]